ncbi:MAG: hypothetical protein HN661_00365 [Gammaproteobacteria bacterium]|jgi:hypothetical protein|nr:hypothetical protein [Gammaproteobacteria bacterium]
MMGGIGADQAPNVQWILFMGNDVGVGSALLMLEKREHTEESVQKRT